MDAGPAGRRSVGPLEARAGKSRHGSGCVGVGLVARDLRGLALSVGARIRLLLSARILGDAL